MTPPSSATPLSTSTITSGIDERMTAFLTQLHVALNRRRTYGAGHPMVISSEQLALAALDAVLLKRSTFTIGVARHELLLNGVAIPSGMSVTRELAARLHRRGVGALTFHSGVDLERLQTMLAWLAREVVKGPDGAAPDDGLPTISGIIIGRLAYDALMLGDADTVADASMAALWQALAQIATDGTGRQYGFGTTRNSEVAAAVGDEEAAFDTMLREEQSITDIASSLQSLMVQPEFARRTAVALMNLAAQGAQAPPELRARIGQRLCDVISRLGDSSFAPIIRGLGQRAAQEEFVLQVVDVLPVMAVSDWLQVAARATEQELSHHLLRLMMKLSQHAAERREGLTDATFRSAAKELVEGWGLSDPNPEEHVRLLDQIALVNAEHASGANAASAVASDSAVSEASRLVQMAIEIDVVGDDTYEAVNMLSAGGSLPLVLQWIEQGRDRQSARSLRAHIMSPDAVKSVLQQNPVDIAAAEALLETIDVSMADTLLEALAKAESRDARELILTRLRGFGEPLRETLIRRLDGASWYFARNLLFLLRDLFSGQGHSDISGMLRFLDHENTQVRVVAVQMMLKVDAVRDAAIRRGLLDPEVQVVEAVLDFLDQWLHVPHTGRPHTISSGAATYLMRFVDEARHGNMLQVIAIRAAATTALPSVRDWLLARVVKRSRFLRRRVLVKQTLLTATALSALQQYYSRDPEVVPVLALSRGIRTVPVPRANAPTPLSLSTQ